MTEEHILRQQGVIKKPDQCTCDDGYWMRNLVDPSCHFHGGYAEELRALITEFCDALDGPRFDALYQRELVQRAREAVK